MAEEDKYPKFLDKAQKVFDSIEFFKPDFYREFSGNFVNYEFAPLGAKWSLGKDWKLGKAYLQTVHFSKEGSRLTVSSNYPDEAKDLDSYTAYRLKQLKEEGGVVAELNPEEAELAGQKAHKIVYTDIVEEGNSNKVLEIWTVKKITEDGKLNDKAFTITFSADETVFDQYLEDVNAMIESYEFV